VAEFRPSVSDRNGDVALVGEIDLAEADELVETVRGCLADADAVTLDFGEVTFIDSSGIGALVVLHKEATSDGKRLFLTNLSPATTRLLQMTGLDGVFDTLPESR
jgi:anti-anti-sigma factor